MIFIVIKIPFESSHTCEGIFSFSSTWRRFTYLFSTRFLFKHLRYWNHNISARRSWWKQIPLKFLLPFCLPCGLLFNFWLSKKKAWRRNNNNKQEEKFLGKQFTPSFHGYWNRGASDSWVRKPTDHRCMPSGGHSSIDSSTASYLYVFIMFRSQYECSIQFICCLSNPSNASPDARRSLEIAAGGWKTIDLLWL